MWVCGGGVVGVVGDVCGGVCACPIRAGVSPLCCLCAVIKGEGADIYKPFHKTQGTAAAFGGRDKPDQP